MNNDGVDGSMVRRHGEQPHATIEVEERLVVLMSKRQASQERAKSKLEQGWRMDGVYNERGQYGENTGISRVGTWVLCGIAWGRSPRKPLEINFVTLCSIFN